MPNCGFNNYALVAVCTHTSFYHYCVFFLGSYELLPLLSRFGTYEMPTPFGSLLTAVSKHIPLTCDMQNGVKR